MKSPGGSQPDHNFHAFREHAPAAIAVFDRDIWYIAYSRRWLQDFNLIGEVLGRSHYDVFPEIPENWRLYQEMCNAERLPLPN